LISTQWIFWYNPVGVYGNWQLAGEICRNGNKKEKWQLKGAEIVVLPYIYLATGNPLVMMTF
jgi:hypothetical protein